MELEKIEVIVTTTLAKGERLSRVRKIDLWMRWLFPSAFAIVAVKSLIF
jgi:hypothetical protein